MLLLCVQAGQAQTAAPGTRTGPVVRGDLQTSITTQVPNGRVLSTGPVGRALDLPVLRETTNAAGQGVREVRDPGGAVIELTLDASGSVVASRVLSPAGAAAGTTPARPGTVSPVPAR